MVFFFELKQGTEQFVFSITKEGYIGTFLFSHLALKLPFKCKNCSALFLWTFILNPDPSRRQLHYQPIYIYQNFIIEYHSKDIS